ncbi:MAG TPA: branched-chain amino acid ABC transporter permease [Trebonia sp.]|jgi:branched-chain amino acid transport system permease protein
MSELIQILISGIASGGIYAAVAVGISLLWRTAQIINFAQGDILMVGAFTAIDADTDWHLPLPLAIVIGIAAAALLGVVIEFAIFRPLRRLPVWYGIIATLGLSIVLENGALRVFGPAPQPFPSYVGADTPWKIGNARIDPQSVVTIGVVLILVVVLELLLRKTMIGKAVRAVSQDADAATSVGIASGRMVLVATVSSCVMAAVAGVLLAPTTFVSFDMGVPISLMAFAAAVIGGLGSIRGAVLGGVVMGVADQLISAYVSSAYVTAIVFGIVVLILLGRPQGLLKEASL